MSTPDVVVVGAGLAGLAAARALQAAGKSFVVLESADAPGGRVRTDLVDGFRLDRGFQVLLTAYPEARRAFDYRALDLRSFAPGAVVYVEGIPRRVLDPWRKPAAALSALFSSVGTLGDKLRLAKFRADVCRGEDPYAPFGLPERSVAEMLRSRHFSPSMTERFFRPFFGGILLDPALESSAAMASFVFRMFAEGDGAVPRLGMGELPRALAAPLPPEAIRCGVRVTAVDDGRVSFVDAAGTKGDVRARAVIAAVPGADLVRTGKEARGYRDVVNVFFAGDGPSPLPGRLLILDGDRGRLGPAANLAFLSDISPDYAPPGKHLASFSLLGDDATAMTDSDLYGAVRAQGAAWFGADAVKSWTPLRVYRVRRALPRQRAPWYTTPDWPTRVRRGMYVAGDERDTASIDGALRSGRLAAEAAIADLRG
jgi:protoporphyrinogen oxidase